MSRFILVLLAGLVLFGIAYGVLEFRKTEAGFQINIEQKNLEKAVDELNKGVDKVQDVLRDSTHRKHKDEPHQP